MLLQMRSEGYQVPPVPFVRVKAETRKEAKMKVLGAASQYGKIEKQGLYEFGSTEELDFGEVFEQMRLPEIDYESFRMEFFDDEDKPSDANEPFVQPGQPDGHKVGGVTIPHGSQVKMVQIFLNEESFQEFQRIASSLRQVYKTENDTDTIMECLRAANQLNNQNK